MLPLQEVEAETSLHVQTGMLNMNFGSELWSVSR